MDLPISSGSISSIIKNNIATLQFTHPASNSFPSQLLSDLSNTFNQLSENPEVKLIVLRSGGEGAFCSGASFDELLAVSTFEQGVAFFSGFANLINAMTTCSKIIVGRIHGKAVGGGVGIIAACDYAFATTNAAIKLSELAIGIGPFVIEPVVSHKIGKTAMSQMTLEAKEWKTANWAHAKGLYARIFENQIELDTHLEHFVSELVTYNPEAMSQLKKVLWQDTVHWSSLLYERAAISGKLVLSEFTKQALNQFKK